jgi:hypothetical protein
MLFKFALGIRFLSFRLSALSSKNKRKTFANLMILGASFAHEIWHLFLSQGLAFGIGMGVCASFHTKFAFWGSLERARSRGLSRELFRELAIMQAPEAAPGSFSLLLGSFSALVFSLDSQC